MLTCCVENTIVRYGENKPLWFQDIFDFNEEGLETMFELLEGDDNIYKKDDNGATELTRRMFSVASYQQYPQCVRELVYKMVKQFCDEIERIVSPGRSSIDA